MVDFLIRWSLAHRAAVLLLAVCLAVGGTWLASRMPVDVLPDLTAPTVTVMVEARDDETAQRHARHIADSLGV